MVETRASRAAAAQKKEQPPVEDVEMKSPGSPAATKEEPDENVKKAERDHLIVEELKEHARQIEKSVNAKEQRLISRILRSLSGTRKNLNSAVLRRIIAIVYNSVPAQRDILLGFTDEPMETGAEAPKSGKSKMIVNLLPEHDVYFNLLVVLYLLDAKKYQMVSDFFCGENFVSLSNLFLFYFIVDTRLGSNMLRITDGEDQQTESPNPGRSLC